jgi:uncharacterized protein (DUF2384 family)
MALAEFTITDARNVKGDLDALLMAEVLGINPTDMAKLLQTTRQNLYRNPASKGLQDKLRQLDGMVVRLKRLTGSLEGARMWLKTAHPALDKQTPLDFIEEGHYQGIEDFIADLEVGEPA